MSKSGVLRKRKYTIHDNISTLLILLYFILYMLNSFTNIDKRVNTYLCFVVALMAIIVSLIRKTKINVLSSEIYFYGLIVFLHFLSILYNNNFSFSSVLLIMRHFFIAMTLARTRLNKNYVAIVFWIFALFSVFLLWTGYYTTGIVRKSSQNIISIYLILFLALYFFENKNNFKLCSWLMILSSLAIIVWSGNRSGIIAVVVVFIGMFICGCKQNHLKHNKTKVFIGVGIAVVLVVVAICFIRKPAGLDSYLHLLTRSRESLFDNVRFRIISEYIQAIKNSFGSLFFGVKLGTTELISFFDNNPHNSYIYAHANFGIIYLFLIVILIIRACKHYLFKKDFLFYILICITIRSFSDITAFAGLYDALFYYLIFEKTQRIFEKYEETYEIEYQTNF